MNPKECFECKMVSSDGLYCGSADELIINIIECQGYIKKEVRKPKK